MGIFAGGELHTRLIELTGSPALTYGIIFGLEAIGLLVSILLLARVNVVSFARDTGRISAAEAQVIASEV